MEAHFNPELETLRIYMRSFVEKLAEYDPDFQDFALREFNKDVMQIHGSGRALKDIIADYKKRYDANQPAEGVDFDI